MTIRIGQLSDTHFVEPREQPEGGFGYDIAAAFDLVRADMAGRDLDLVVVTGDVADHGRSAQYELAAESFAQLEAVVACTPGNHDRHLEFQSGTGGGRVTAPRVLTIENWCFAFVDSNAGVMLDDGHGQLTDPDYRTRLRGNGALGRVESDWLREVCATTSADHVFVWVHHPPGTGDGAVTPTPEYEADWTALLGDLPIIRGLGAGHTHIPISIEFAGRPVHIGPSLKNNFDLERETFLPPGWRSYEFDPDGTVTSRVELVDSDQFPRHRLPRSVLALLRGELSHDEFEAIVARRARR